MNYYFTFLPLRLRFSGFRRSIIHRVLRIFSIQHKRVSFVNMFSTFNAYFTNFSVDKCESSKLQLISHGSQFNFIYIPTYFFKLILTFYKQNK